MDIIDGALCDMFDFLFYDHPTASIVTAVLLLVAIVVLVSVFGY
jgi:hypothetical protein